MNEKILLDKVNVNMDQSEHNITNSDASLSTNILTKLPPWLIEMTEYVFNCFLLLFLQCHDNKLYI